MIKNTLLFTEQDLAVSSRLQSRSGSPLPALSTPGVIAEYRHLLRREAEEKKARHAGTTKQRDYCRAALHSAHCFHAADFVLTLRPLFFS